MKLIGEPVRRGISRSFSSGVAWGEEVVDDRGQVALDMHRQTGRGPGNEAHRFQR